MTLFEILTEIERYLIVLFGILMAYVELAQAIKFRKAWTKWALGFMGIYWALYYIYAIIRPYFAITLPTHQVFVRAGVLLTIVFVWANAYMTLKLLKRSI